MVCPYFINCMSRCLIFGVVSEVVARMCVLCHPLRQLMHVLRHTEQLVTCSLVAVMMGIRGGGKGGIQPQELYTPTME